MGRNIVLLDQEIVNLIGEEIINYLYQLKTKEVTINKVVLVSYKYQVVLLNVEQFKSIKLKRQRQKCLQRHISLILMVHWYRI